MPPASAIERPARTALWRDAERCYRAVRSRDARFDGQFILAVRTTGIYCRPSCPAVTPKPGNAEFFPTAAAAQTHGYRACRRCLPDAVPGSPEWNTRADLAARAMRLIADGEVDRTGVAGLARTLGYSVRQLGRVLTAELGAGPLALARAHRAHSSRLLIEMSGLPLTDVAFAAGFHSVRQFNDTIREVFGATPTELRAAAMRRGPADDGIHDDGHDSDTRRGAKSRGSGPGTRLRLRLPFRPPFDAAGLLDFFAARAVTRVESVGTADGADGGARDYRRTLRLPHGTGHVRLTPAPRHLDCVLWLSDVRDLSGAVTRMRRLFDLDTDPHAIAECLRTDTALAPAVTGASGIRLPGAVDGPELLLRALLGRQVSVAAARTAAHTLTEALGEPLPAARAGDPDLLFPTPAAVAEHAHTVLRGPRRRIDEIRGVAAALANADLDLHVGRAPEELRRDLLAVSGIGPWTADYVVLRLLGHPDVLLDGDLVVRRGARALGLDTEPTTLRERARAWQPWRSYACLYLWRAGGTASRGGGPARTAAAGEDHPDADAERRKPAGPRKEAP